MAKRRLKTQIAAEQDNACALTDEQLPSDTALFDTDRLVAKAEGGTYDPDNTRVAMPYAHMERHGNLRIRPEHLDQLKMMIDDREQVMKLKLKVDNQVRAYMRRTDRLSPETVELLQAQSEALTPVLNVRSARIEGWIKAHRLEDRVIDVPMNVPNLGPITVAYLTAYVDLTIADTVSSLWKYCGLHAASHERYTKGVKSGGNKALRTVMWNAANVMMKDRTSPYRSVYDNTKHRLESSEREVRTRNTAGDLVTATWQTAKPSHRHGAALRAVMKHLLADYWFVGRTLLGLPTRPLYVQEVLGHTHIVAPEERGWQFVRPE